MNEQLETVTFPEVAKIWCDEFMRTTGCKATVVKLEGDWIYIKTPSHEGQPWQRSHFIHAIQTLRARPDFGSSIYADHDFRARDDGGQARHREESGGLAALNVA